MKKLSIVISGVVALWLIWGASAWYTGKTAEKIYQQEIAKFNQSVAKTDFAKKFHIQYHNQTFERGVFSSKINDEIEISQDDTVFRIPLTSTLYHGPLPLNQLSQFDFSPSLFSLESLLEKNQTTEVLFSLTNEHTPLKIRLSSSYGKNIKGDLIISPGHFNHDKGGIDWSEMMLSLNADKSSSIKYRFFLDSFEFKNLEALNAPTSFKMKEVSMSGDMQPTVWTFIFTGKGNSHIAYMEHQERMASNEIFTVTQKNVRSESNVTLSGNDAVNISTKSTSDNVQLNDKEIGQVSNQIVLNHIDGDALQQILDMLVNTEQQTRNQEFVNKLQSLGMKIVNNQPKLAIHSSLISGKDEKNNVDMEVGLVKNPRFDLLRSGLYKQFTDFSIHVNLNKESISRLLLSFANDDKSSLESYLNDLIQSGENNGIVVNNEKDVIFTLSLKNNQLLLNDKEIPEEQIKMLLFMMFMNTIN